MTEETGENSPKDEDDTTNMDISKCAKLFFYRYLTAAPNKTLQFFISYFPSLCFKLSGCGEQTWSSTTALISDGFALVSSGSALISSCTALSLFPKRDKFVPKIWKKICTFVESFIPYAKLAVLTLRDRQLAYAELKVQ